MKGKQIVLIFLSNPIARVDSIMCPFQREKPPLRESNVHIKCLSWAPMIVYSLPKGLLTIWGPG